MDSAGTKKDKNVHPKKGENCRKTAANRFAVLNEFVDCSLAGLSKVELMVWLVLYRDTRNGTARTSQADIARRGGVSVRAVQYATSRMERRGLLRCVYRGGLNRGPNRWRVLPAASKPRARNAGRPSASSHPSIGSTCADRIRPRCLWPAAPRHDSLAR